MYFREALRVRRCLFTYLIVLGVLIALQMTSNLAQYGGVFRITISPDVPHQLQIPLSLLFAISGVATTIFAGILATCLSVENNGHLELAWTKPASRIRYALSMLGVDAAGMAVFWLMTLVAIDILLALTGHLSHVAVDGEAWHNLLRYLAVPLGWYGVNEALTASARQRGGMVAGLSWVGALILIALGIANLAHPWSDIVGFILYVNPLAYASYAVGMPQPPFPFHTWYLNFIGLIVLGILGVVAALTQWRRLEA